MIPITVRNRSRLGIDEGLAAQLAAPDWQGVRALSRRRQADPQRAGLVRPWRDGRVAAVETGDLPYQGETEPGALAVAAGAMERGENLVALGFRDAGAAVGDLEDRLSRLPCQRDRD